MALSRPLIRTIETRPPFVEYDDIIRAAMRLTATANYALEFPGADKVPI